MKLSKNSQIFSKIILCSLACISFLKSAQYDCTQSQNLWQPHAFSVSMSRELLLEKPIWGNEQDHQNYLGTFGVGFEFMGNLNQSNCCKNLGSMPFWPVNNSNIMTVGDNSGTYSLDAYQLGLGPITTNASIKLNPQIYQTGADLFFYAQSQQQHKQVFFKAHCPIGVISVNPCLSSNGDTNSVDYEAFQIQNSFNDIAAPYENIVQAFKGSKQAGDLAPLSFGRICNQSSSIQFGDFAASLGYNLYADEDKHIGIGVRFTAPTGNKAKSIYMLEPIFGRNGHWAAGAELIAHYKIKFSNQDSQYLNLLFDGTIEHLFTSKHFRSFDLLKNGPGSKYLLLADYTNNEYQNKIINAINITTLPVQSVFGIEANAALMLDYHHDDFSVGIGYEAWARSCEELCLDAGCSESINFNNYAILGRQNIRDDLCDPNATINKSLNEGSIWASDVTDKLNRMPKDIAKAINVNGQKAHAAFTNKVFGQLAYTKNSCDYAPYIAISTGAELSSSYNNAVSFWTIGMQGGFVF